MRSIAVFAAATLVATAMPAWAVCQLPGKAPPVPAAVTSTQADMKAAHDLIQAYVKQLEAYQTCINQEIASAPANLPIETKAGWRAQSDAAVDAAQSIADSYNEQQKLFKARGQ